MNLVASMNFDSGILVDVVLLAIIVWKIISGVRNGAVRMLGGLVSLGCGIYAGRLIRQMFAETVARRLILPAITNTLQKAMDNLGLADLFGNLPKILDNSGLPGFLRLDVLDQIAERLQETGETALQNAAEVISIRLAGIILFIVSLVLVTVLVRILFNGVVDPLIRNLPVLNEANRLLGGILGAALGILLAGLILAICYRLLPVFSQRAGQIFSEASIRGSILMKQYFRLFPGVFKR